jgi:hypothetical protein
LVLRPDGGRIPALTLANAQPTTRWHVRPHAGGWQALVRLPAGAATLSFALNLWSVPSAEPELLPSLK